MQKHEDNLVRPSSGGILEALVGATVSVIDQSTGLAPLLYSDNGTTQIAVAIVTDSLGYYSFYAADGRYTLTYTGSTFVTFTREIILEDSVGDQSHNPAKYGGIGDGLSHPLSSRYATLAAAQAVYSFATSLTQQIDWCAMVAMFRQAKIDNQECKLLSNNWYVIDPLEVIGTATAPISTERGNFKISGESMHNAILTFSIASDALTAMEFIGESSGWDISNFRVKNLTPYYGTGIKFNAVYTSTVHNIHSFHFNIGVDKLSYVSTFTDVVGANCNCGIYDRGGTSTTNTALYGASCIVQPGEVRTYDYLGCGYYITGGVYSKYDSCASDGNVTAYAVKTTDSYGGSNPTQTITFDNCGAEVCTNGWVVDAPKASITLIRPSAYTISSGYLASVTNAISVEVRDFADNSLHKINMGANIGAGVVRIERGFSTGGNPSSYPLTNVPTVGGYGIDDFAYEGFAPLTQGAGGVGTAVGMAIGRMITAKNQIEFELYARSNGNCATAKIEISLLHNYSGANIDRAGTVFVCASNAAAYLETGCVSKTNTSISVTETQITDGGVMVGMRYLIRPFNGLASNSTNTVALFRVETVFSPIGGDGNGKNHNIKLAGTYTGRVNCRLKGVDY